MEIGDFVRFVVPKDKQMDHTTIGRVLAIEKYTDMQSSKIWYYVSWVIDGKPSQTDMKHSRGELEKIEETEHASH